jgi:putative PIG3 family NAD(P)H quinone oxidoreductase
VAVVHAVVVSEPGGPEVLRWTEVADPSPGPGEVLLDVAASAVNRADLMQRIGRYPPPSGAAPYPGLECSGRVSALGAGVTGWSIGDAACALLAGGGYAERVVVPAGQLLPVPDGLDLVSAAALPEVACTVWANVFSLARLAAGETLLVHGGASGIGTMAIQLAAHHGATVAATAGSAAKVARCRELGARIAVNYRDEDFVARVREETGGHGADVVLDNMGAAYLGRNVDVLAVGGRLVVIGLQGGRAGELDLSRLMAKQGALHATTLRARPPAEKARIVAEVRAHVWPLLEQGAVRPVIDRTVPMRDAAAAHRLVESSEHVGKVVLTV